MFYNIKNSLLTEIPKKPILEKDLQQLVEKNLESLFSLRFVETELSIENVRFDTLAFDTETNSPVIIEFKKSFEKSLFDQGLEYLNILFSRKADFTITLHKKIGISPDPDCISWGDARVIFVANRFSERQKRAVSFQGLPIELWSYEWLKNDVFKLEKETLEREAKLSELTKSIGNEAVVIKKVQREIKEYDRADYQKLATPLAWEIFEKVENILKDIGNFETRYRKNYIAFMGKQSFCVVKILKSKIQVEFGKAKDITLFADMKSVRDIASKKWNHALMCEVSTESDLDTLMVVFKRLAKDIE